MAAHPAGLVNVSILGQGARRLRQDDSSNEDDDARHSCTQYTRLIARMSRHGLGMSEASTSSLTMYRIFLHRRPLHKVGGREELACYGQG